MVGALADWFAVTALFRHPLGLPIPHTAIIPRKKDQIGASLGTFVQENFLTRAVVEQKLDHDRRPRPAGRLPGRARPRRAAGRRRRGRAQRSDRPAPRRGRAAGRRRAGRPQAARDAGRPRRWRGCSSWWSRATGTRRCCRRRCAAWPGSCTRTGWCSARSWATPRPPGCPTGSTTGCSTGSSPALQGFLDEVGGDPRHELRRSYDARLRAYVHALRTDPATAARVEELKKELLEHPAVRTWSGSLWTNAKNAVLGRGRRPGLASCAPAWPG